MSLGAEHNASRHCQSSACFVSGRGRSGSRPLHKAEWIIALTLVTLTYITGAAACMPDGATNSGLTQGKPTFVCLVFSHPSWGTGDSNFSRVAFTPSADKFTRLQFSDSKSIGGQCKPTRRVTRQALVWAPMNGDIHAENVLIHYRSAAAWILALPNHFFVCEQYSNNVLGYENTTDQDTLLQKYGGQVAIHVESMGVLSYQKNDVAWWTRVSGFHSNNQCPQGGCHGGKLCSPGCHGAKALSMPFTSTEVATWMVWYRQGIVFDTGCVLCDNNDRCIANTYTYQGAVYSGAGATSDCYLTNAECSANPTLCQTALYVVWTGTDKNGNYLTSASRRFSLFSSFSVNSYFNGLGKAVKSTRYNQYNTA